MRLRGLHLGASHLATSTLLEIYIQLLFPWTTSLVVVPCLHEVSNLLTITDDALTFLLERRRASLSLHEEELGDTMCSM